MPERTSRPRKRSFACLFKSPREDRTSQLSKVVLVSYRWDTAGVLEGARHVQPADDPHLEVVMDDKDEPSKIRMSSEAKVEVVKMVYAIMLLVHQGIEK